MKKKWKEAGDLQEVKKSAENCHMEKPQLVDQAQAEKASEGVDGDGSSSKS